VDINILKKNGLIIQWKDGLWEVKYFEHTRRPGRGGVFVKTKLKNLETGEVITKNFIEADNFKPVELRRLSAVYLYQKGDFFSFMLLPDYEEVIIPQKVIGENEKFLKEGQELEILFFENKPVNIVLPKKVALKVVEAPEAIKGDSATGPTKIVILETGIKVSTPIFVKQGETILINTETGQYVERVS
jgi:elongation factor P